MANKAIEKRLQSLQEKRTSLDSAIKKIQAEKARSLRRRQQQREAIVGRLIYQLTNDGAAIQTSTWSEQFLLSLVEKHVTCQRDRQLFGLTPLVSDDDARSNSRQSDASAHNPKVKSGQKPEQKAADQRTSKETGVAEAVVRSAIPQKIEKKDSRFIAADGQSDLMDEFNL